MKTQRHEKAFIFCGPYGNFQALQKIIHEAFSQGYRAHEIFCLGDVAAYCAQPRECYRLLAAYNITCIAGNVEEQIASGADNCGCNFEEGSSCDVASAVWFDYTQSQLLESDHVIIKQIAKHNHMVIEVAGKKILLVHGDDQETSKWIFESSDWDTHKQPVFDRHADIDAVVAGHSGLPFVQEKDGKIWANAGVIGMPANDGTTRGWYLTINPSEEGLDFETHTFDYPFKATQSYMKGDLVPTDYRDVMSTYHEALGAGIWPSVDVLPIKEREKTGQPLQSQKVVL